MCVLQINENRPQLVRQALVTTFTFPESPEFDEYDQDFATSSDVLTYAYRNSYRSSRSSFSSYVQFPHVRSDFGP